MASSKNGMPIADHASYGNWTSSRSGSGGTGMSIGTKAEFKNENQKTFNKSDLSD